MYLGRFKCRGGDIRTSFCPDIVEVIIINYTTGHAFQFLRLRLICLIIICLELREGYANRFWIDTCQNRNASQYHA